MSNAYLTADGVSVDARQLDAPILNEDESVHVAQGMWAITYPGGSVVYCHPDAFPIHYTPED